MAQGASSSSNYSAGSGRCFIESTGKLNSNSGFHIEAHEGFGWNGSPSPKLLWWAVEEALGPCGRIPQQGLFEFVSRSKSSPDRNSVRLFIGQTPLLSPNIPGLEEYYYKIEGVLLAYPLNDLLAGGSIHGTYCSGFEDFRSEAPVVELAVCSDQNQNSEGLEAHPLAIDFLDSNLKFECYAGNLCSQSPEAFLNTAGWSLVPGLLHPGLGKRLGRNYEAIPIHSVNADCLVRSAGFLAGSAVCTRTGPQGNLRLEADLRVDYLGLSYLDPFSWNSK